MDTVFGLEPIRRFLRSWDQTGSMTWSDLSSTAILGSAIILVGIAMYQVKAKSATSRKLLKRSALDASEVPIIQELKKFDWKSTEPVKIWPIKPIYHLTMALESLDPNDLLLMDRTYHDRITYRQQILKEHPSIALGVNDEARIRPAVEELYAFIFGTYLSIRYPSMFKIHHVNFNSGSEVMLENLITQKLISTCTSSRPTTKLSALLTTLACNVDEDFLFLLPREEVPARQDPKYLLEAYVSCCPSGFNPAEKLGRELREIHGPVPGYVEKLEASVDRFFRKLEVGRYVKRANWSVTMSAELFEPGLGTNHAHPGDEVTEFEGPVDADQTYLRCERQTLHRLPKSKAIVFAFKTYMYPLRQIKEEGLGEELADAIDGLTDGSVPRIHFYKRGDVWARAVKEYLRS